MDDFEIELDTDDAPKRNPVYSVLAGGVPDRRNLVQALQRGLLDLDRADLGHPAIPSLWERLHDDRRPVEQRGMFCPECYLKDPDHPEWMYLRFRNGRREAVHHNREHKAHGESPEHAAYKERIARAAEEGGFTADIEAGTTDRSVRNDVRVRGESGRVFGFEPQLSRIEAATARKREKQRAANGITSVWHVVDAGAPLIDHVHYTRSDNLPAYVIRTHRELPIRGGARGLEPFRCDSRSPVPCPVKKVGRCGQWHPQWVPAERGFDSMVRDIAAGLWVPVVQKIDRKLARFWCSANDRDRYVELGGVVEDEGASSTSGAVRLLDPRDRDAECTRTRERSFEPGEKVVRDSGERLRPAVTLSGGPNQSVALLNWRDRMHWASSEAPCIHCGRNTQLRDTTGRPAHKVCSEAAANA